MFAVAVVGVDAQVRPSLKVVRPQTDGAWAFEGQPLERGDVFDGTARTLAEVIALLVAVNRRDAIAAGAGSSTDVDVF